MGASLGSKSFSKFKQCGLQLRWSLKTKTRSITDVGSTTRILTRSVWNEKIAKNID